MKKEGDSCNTFPSPSICRPVAEYGTEEKGVNRQYQRERANEREERERITERGRGRGREGEREKEREKEKVREKEREGERERERAEEVSGGEEPLSSFIVSIRKSRVHCNISGVSENMS